MSLAELQAISERFRLVAHNLAAVDDLADEIDAAHPLDAEANALTARMRGAADADCVRMICDWVAARKV